MYYFRLLRLPILAGILIGTSYIPFPPWAIFFCLVPLWLFWLEQKSVKLILWSGWLTQFILNLIGFHWIAHTAHEFGEIPWILSFLVLIGYAATAHLYYPLAGAAWFYLNRYFKLKTIASTLLIVCLFGVLEWIYPMIFHWHLGYPWLWIGLPAVQTTDVIGFEGLNIITLFINALLLLAYQFRAQRKWQLASITSALVLFLGINFWGLNHGKEWKQTDAELKVLTVQANIGNFMKLQAEKGQFQSFIVDKYIELSNEALKRFPDSDVFFWPETAFPGYFDLNQQNTYLAQKVRTFISQNSKNILLGAYSHENSGDNSPARTYNGFFHLDSKNLTLSPAYRKTYLLAFGEYYPGARFLPAAVLKYFGISEFSRGSGPLSWDTRLAKYGPQICYEGLYPEFSAGLAAKGAEIFVNVTNDSWFGYSFEPYQHLYMTLARAIEFRRPLVRSTNTGISTAILASGEILQQSPRHQEWSGQFKIPFLKNPPHTFYEKFVNMWTYFLIVFAFLLIGFGREKSSRP